jgi:hypothetical protein
MKKKPVKILKGGQVLVYSTVKQAATALGVTPAALWGSRHRGSRLRCGAIVITDSKIYN